MVVLRAWTSVFPGCPCGLLISATLSVSTKPDNLDPVRQPVGAAGTLSPNNLSGDDGPFVEPLGEMLLEYHDPAAGSAGKTETKWGYFIHA